MKHTQQGFTLIELILVLAVLAIFTFLAFTSFSGGGDNKISWGINGMTETRCIAGYKHVVGEGGQARQILDKDGKGVPCND